MSFTSFQFIGFYIGTVLIHYLLPQRFRNIFLLVASLYFYKTGGARNLIFLSFSILTTFFITRKLAGTSSENEPRTKKLYLASLIIINLLVLFFFKYDFSFGPFSWIMPLGISFYTFQLISYAVDVYRGKIKAEKNLIDFALFMSFFPYVISGPISRGADILPQIKAKRTLDVEQWTAGGKLLLLGCFKKVVVADTIAPFVDYMYADYDLHGYQGGTLIILVVLYAIQLYADFSGYSDMASGAAQMLGFKLRANFVAPYLTKSFSQFWNHWHITLGHWLKDYVYIPLGGNRKGVKRKCINLFLVFVISGIWHGSTWSFVLWGMMHGCFRVVEELIQRCFPGTHKAVESQGTENSKRSFWFVTKSIAKWLVVQSLVAYAWILFRADSVRRFLAMTRQMFNFESWRTTLNNISDIFLLTYNESASIATLFKWSLIASIICLIYIDIKEFRSIPDVRIYRDRTTIFSLSKKWLRYGCYFIIILWIVLIYWFQNSIVGQTSSFIYFQF
jgi:alginate O-acetyltransferase complex protein AlgI